MSKKKSINVGDVVEWLCIDMLAMTRLHLMWVNKGKRETPMTAAIRVIQLLENTGLTREQAIKFGNEIHSGFIHSIDSDNITLRPFDSDRHFLHMSEINLPPNKMRKIINKLS